MKLGIFADPHYCSADRLCGTRRPSLSFQKIKESLEFFKQEKVDLVVCMGDLTDHSDTHEEALNNLDSLVKLIKESRLLFWNVPGNHDYLDFSAEELEQHGLRTPPYSEVICGIRFVVLDANYRTDMRRFDIAGVEWTDSNLPPDQVRFLREILNDSEERCIILVHESLDNMVEEHHIIKNAEEVRKIIKESGKVDLVLQGHFHPGADHLIDEIRYLTAPAMCEGEENRYFVVEI